MPAAAPRRNPCARFAAPRYGRDTRPGGCRSRAVPPLAFAYAATAPPPPDRRATTTILALALADVRHVEKRRMDPVATTVAVLGSIIGTALVAFGVLLLMLNGNYD